MMRLLLFCVLGVAAYALLPAPEEPDWNADATIAAAPVVSQADRKLRSWGPTLKSLGRHPETRSASSGQAGPSAPLAQDAAYRPGIAAEPLASETPPGDLAAQVEAQQVAWVKLILAAKVHSAASVSSPVVRIYGAGRELEVVGREDGWLELRDPVTLERGFVFESYVVAIDSPGSTRAALESTPELKPAKAALPKAATRAAGVKPTTHAADNTEDPRYDRRWLTRKEERRERRLFRWFGSRDAALAPMTVGAPR
jgi:hypothetical protein